MLEGHPIVHNRLIPAAMLAAFVAACATPAGLRSDSDDALAKKFVAAPGMSAIYLVRPDTLRKMPLAVSLDDKLTARSLPCSYVVWHVEPGAHRLSAYGENVTQLSLQTEADKLYFVRQDAAGGLWMPRTQLSLLDEANGRSAVAQCQLADSAAAPAK